MTNIYQRVITGICALIVIGWTAGQSTESVKHFRLAYFEGGQYPVHSILRKEFTHQLRLVLPEGYEIAFVPEGYRSARWKRDSCRVMAKQLAAVQNIDMLIAMGPWVVEDLLEAGFTKPILAMHQFDPMAQGLVGDEGRPVANNLTVHVKPGQIEDDLRTLTKLVNVRRLGVLYFPSNDEGEKVISAITSLGKTFNFEVITAEGYDNYGTYAFFKAYHQLDKKIDALYLLPMWGMNDNKVGEFFSLAARNSIPTFTSEGRYLVERGALGSNTAYSIVSDARYNAVKAARILQGELPVNLPIEFRGGTALALNEQTAQQCSVTLPMEAVSSAYLVVAPVPETTPHYTLTDAVERTLSYNPGYLARYDAVEAAIQAAKQAYSTYLPQVVAGASMAHFDDNAVANSRGAFENDRYRSTLLLHQRIFSAETIKSIQLAAKQKNLERINLQQAKLDLELAVTAAYLNYLGAWEILQTQLRFCTLVDRNLEIAGTRFLIEEGSEIDLLRWRDERHKATLRIIHARSDLKVAAVLLNVMFNLPGSNPIALDTLSFSESHFWSDYDLLHFVVPDEESQRRLQDALVAKGLQQNPAMRSFNVDIAIQRDLLSKNRARYYPTLDFRASFNYADQLADYPPTFVEKNTTWSVWGGLTLPVFLGTDRIRESARLKAKLNQVEFEKDAIGLEVMGKISTGMYNLIAHVNSLPRAIRSAELARENLMLVIEKYDAGKLGLVDLVDALNNARDVELNSIVARYTFYLSMAQLVHDIGWSAYDGNVTFREEFLRRLEEHTNK
jgi:outer membrane protein TolC